MKNLLLTVLITFATGYCFGQKIIERKRKITAYVTEQFQSVIEATKQVKQGEYQAFFGKKTIIATGTYKDDKRIGTWQFFDPNGRSMEVYDYDSNTILQEAREDAKTRFSYKIDRVINKEDITTKPVRLGGRYFGYVPYIRIFKLPADLAGLDYEQCAVVLELFVSPMGRLADFNIHLVNSHTGQEIRVLNVNTDNFTDEDKTFIPATYNHTAVSSTISVGCFLDKYGVIDL